MAYASASNQIQASAIARPVTRPGACFSCSACNDNFCNVLELREHWKSERHLYNMRHMDMFFTPLTQMEWDAERGLPSQGEEQPLDDETDQASSSCSTPTASQNSTDDSESCDSFSPQQCLFDHTCCETVDEVLTYMEKRYSFYIPAKENLVDVVGLLTFLGRKLSQPPHSCICCNRSFPNLASVRRHMLDKNHTRIGVEVHSRRGRYNASRTLYMKDAIKQFYASSASASTLQDPTQSSELENEECNRVGDTDQKNAGLTSARSPKLHEEVSLQVQHVLHQEPELIIAKEFDLVSECNTGLQKSGRESNAPHVLLDLTASGELRLANGASARHREHGRTRRHVGKELSCLETLRPGRHQPLKELVRSGNASVSDLMSALERLEAERKEWVGVVGVKKAHYEHAPRNNLAVTKKGLWDGSGKMNNERGHLCFGQGKRHQNAAVCSQPKKHGGKLAKWYSGPKHKPQDNME